MKKRVLIFCHGYNSPFIDVCNQYAAVFNRSQYEVTVAYLVGEPTEEVSQKTLAEHVYFFNQAKKTVRGAKLFALKEVLQFCREKQFSIIICHRYKPVYIISLVSLFIKIPKIFAVMHAMGTLKRCWRKLFIYLFSRKQVIFAGVSNAVRQDILQAAPFLNKDKVVVLSNALDVAAFEQLLIEREQARRELGLQIDDFVLGTMGRLIDDKDHESLIRAFAEITVFFPQVKLVIMGKGPQEKALKQLARQYEITHKIIFTGYLERSFRYIKAFDIYVSTSIKEAFGRALLEAMVGRVPIIATAVNGVPEVVGAAGILVPEKQLPLLIKAMQDMINLPAEQLKLFGETGYKRACSCFSLEKFGENFLKLIC